MKVSVCMIARNESPVVEQAIRSTAGLADEVVLVDTGSTDDTLERARAAGATVLEGGDRWHKAAARNTAIDAAAGDWIVILDCDEVIADPAGVRKFLQTTKKAALYVRIDYMNGFGFDQMRIWRKQSMQYKYRAHEVPLPAGGVWPAVGSTKFVWEHRQSGVANTTWKRPYTLARILMDCEENPGDPRCLFYAGREWCYAKAWTIGRETLGRYLAVAAETDPDRAEAHGYLAQGWLAEGNHEAALEAYREAARIQPHRREWLGCAAEIEYGRKHYAEAAGLLSSAVILPRPKTGYVVERWYGSYPYDLLARALYYLGRKDLGRPFAQKAVVISPSDERLQKNLACFA